METKIALTEREIEVIKMHLNGEVDIDAPEDIQQTMMEVINKAEALRDELDAFDEVMETEACDLILWYYNKYKEQDNSRNND